MGSSLCRRQPSTFDNPLNGYAQINDDLDRAIDLVMDSSQISSRLKLRFECEKLPNMDYFSLTDAFLVVFELQKNGNWLEIDRTEVVEDCLDPKFIKTVNIIYYFEQDQRFKVVAYDADEFGNPHLSLEDSNYIGEAEFEIQKLVCKPDRILEVNFHDSLKIVNSVRGKVRVTFEETKGICNQVLELTLKVEEGDFSINCSYFYIIAKKENEINRKYVPIMRSELVSYKQNDDCWRKCSIPISSLVSSRNPSIEINYQEFQIQLYRHSKNGDHKLLSTFETTVMNIIENVDMINFKSSEKEEFLVRKVKCSLITIPSFLDYIDAGLNMNLIIGVDFTGSNGDPKDRGSLHYIGDGKNNQYLNAIYEVGRILLNFDTDKEVPLFGFGAVWPKYSKNVSHCFALNENYFRPEVSGIEGIAECYKNVLNQVTFSGPTYFSRMLKMWNDMVQYEYAKNKLKYYIFLILTDGAIHDVDDTVDCIVESSSLPISIIIVGIGNADFSTMDFLDADDSPLFSTKYQKFQERDNVQFVEYNKYKHSDQLLARQTLEELPRQMLEFYRKRNISPRELKYEYVDMEARDYFSKMGMEFVQKQAEFMYPNQTFAGSTDGKDFYMPVPDCENVNPKKIWKI